MKVGDIEHIIVIESLEGERQTGNELYNDCIVRNIDRLKSNISAVFRSVNSKEEFRDVFKFYQNESFEMKGGILVHLEMHGDVDLRGVVLSNRDLITWEEVVELCRPINIITRNQLYLSFASCHGRDLYKGVDLNLKCPYSGYISASTDILPEEIVEQYTLLFENLIETGNLVNACLYMQENGSRFFYKDSEEVFLQSIKNTYDRFFMDPEIRTVWGKKVNDEFQKMGYVVPASGQIEIIEKLAYEHFCWLRRKAFLFP